MRLGLFHVIFLACLLMPAGASADSSLSNLKKALDRYDPILDEDTVLEGILHFPEVEKVMPIFYRQLFERVSLHLSVSREDFKIEARGKSEDLKELLRNQLVSIEQELRVAFQQMLENDPIYRMKYVVEHPLNYEMKTTKHRKSTAYHFKLKNVLKNESSEKPMPELLRFFPRQRRSSEKKWISFRKISVLNSLFILEKVRESIISMLSTWCRNGKTNVIFAGSIFFIAIMPDCVSPSKSLCQL